ncbi:MAG: NAD(P)-binding domain-containing protein, partial [Pirellulales bacterium]
MLSSSSSAADGAASSVDCSQRVCIIGAGSSGLACLRTLQQQGLPVDCLERDADIGGIWQFDKPTGGIYASTHLISSKRQTEFPDFPMPKEYPPFPSHREVFAYFQEYARQFGLYDAIEFNTTVTQVERVGELWRVTLAEGQQRDYGALIIANGHNWDPRLPELPGEFTGTTLHSHDYKSPDILAGRRVLVVGAGNSGCDIAVESAQHAAITYHSTRRGYHYLPKFLFGRPIDSCGEQLLRWRLPLA